MNRNIAFFFIFILLLSCQSEKQHKLAVDFKSPPAQTRPWVYWYWIDENISKEGITKDLEAMDAVGIGRALIGHISPGVKRGPVRILSEEWWEMVEHAVRGGQRLNVDIGFFNGPGWSQSGGPWITKEQAMRHIVSREYVVKGPGLFREKISFTDSLFEPVALQAFPVSVNNTDHEAGKIHKVSANPTEDKLMNLFDNDPQTHYQLGDRLMAGGTQWIDIHLAEPILIQALEFSFGAVPFSIDVEVQTGQPNGHLQTLRKFTLDRRNINFEIGPMRYDPVNFSIPATKTAYLRLVFSNLFYHSGAALTGIRIKTRPVVDQPVEKQLGKMYSDPLPPWDAYKWPAQDEPPPGYAIQPDHVIDLSGNLHVDGFVEWQIPEGDWIIIYSGMVPTGATNVPVPPEATGFECDKFTEEAIETHFNAFIGKFLERIPPGERTSLKTIVIDSYEVGPQNWTTEFRDLFIAAFDYDPFPWLPVLAGHIVGTADQSNRFLWDMRRLTADLIAKVYVNRLRELTNEAGLDLWLENYGHWGFPAEFLQYGGQANNVSGEFWYENDLWDLGPMECRAASSAAHIYGNQKVFAEAYTAGFSFRQYPAVMKTRGDEMFCEGINHSVLHLYIHQPWEDRMPGVNAWFGMSYQRHNTWFRQSRSWIEYLQRCHFMLQQGLPVSDIAYFIGEDAPKMTGILEPDLPDGYDYDFINADVIMNRFEVRDGDLVLPDGKTYHLLVLPPQETMRPELLERIHQLVREGARIAGPPPDRSPSMADYPEADQEVKRLAAELWGTDDRQGRFNRHYYGQGMIYQEIEPGKILEEIGFPPDVLCADSTIRWTHRQTSDLDIYFLSNQEQCDKTIAISFRVLNKIPELWFPDTGERNHPGDYEIRDQRTHLSLKFDPAGSVFVVFRSVSDLAPGPEAGVNRRETASLTLKGPWEVRFPSGWDTPDRTGFDSLFSWTSHPDTGIRYFSGTATYVKEFEFSGDLTDHVQDLLLDLGEVHMMAEVILNGENLGVLWKPPYQVPITAVIKPGKNDLVIRITNTWWNRLIGDERYPEGFPGSELNGPRTFTTNTAWKAEDDLMPAGLLGPVRVLLLEDGRR